MIMTIIGRIKDNELLIAGQINERLPSVINGLIAHYPFDGTIISYIPNQIRYIRDWLGYGSTSNGGSHWIEIKAIDFNGTNVALNKLAYINNTPTSTCPNLVDGVLDSNQWSLSNMSIGPSVTVDLGDLYNINLIKIWHYYDDGRTYHKTKTEVSNDGINWFVVFDSIIEGEYAETSVGHTIDLTNLGTTCKPMTNTNTTLTYDGIAVEETTTNLVANPMDPSKWSTNKDPAYGFISEEIINTTLGTQGLRRTITGTDYRGTLVSLPWTITPTDMTKSYTFSIYARSINGNGKIDLNYQGADSTGTRKDISIIYNLTREWTKLLLTAIPGDSDFSSIINNMKIYTQSSTSTIPATVEITMPQMEQKPFATSCVDGSRLSNGKIEIPLSISGDFSLAFKFKPDNQYYQTESAGYNKIMLSMYDSDLIRKIDYTDYTSTPGTSVTESVPFFNLEPNSSWDSVTHHWHHTYTYKKNKWHNYFMIKSENTMRIYVVMDGIILVNTIFTYTNSNLLNNFVLTKLVLDSAWCGIFKDFSIYNKALNDNEIIQLYKSKFSINQNGNIKSFEVIERPNHMPNDVCYYPLDTKASDEYNLYFPSEESNLIYENGTVWVGSSYNNSVSNPTGILGATSPGSYTPGWDNALHSTAITVSNWSGGYNSGVTSPTIGYHAQWVYEGINGSADPCMKFIDHNDLYDLGHRWLGISEQLASVTSSLGWTVGTQITVSWYQKSDVFNKGAQVGLYHYSIANGTMLFGTATNTIMVKQTGIWERKSFTVVIDNDWDLTKSTVLYVYGNSGSYGTLWVDNVMVNARPFITPFTDGSQSSSSLEYNLNSSLGLDWNGNWSIVYWKYPVGTYNNTLTGYDLESLGCNSNSVGGGYIYWGKVNDANSIQNSTPSTMNPNDYFNRWIRISLVKSGGTLTIKEMPIGGQTYTRTVSYSTIASNYFVTQYGYDFKLGGWDNSSPPNAYYRDLIVAKRALTDDELQSLYRSQLSSFNSKLQISDKIHESVVLI